MADSQIPGWLKNLPLAPEYHPTETEFADPIAFISRIEREAAAYGICKVIPPLPRPSKRFVLANLNRSFAKYPDLGPGASAPSPETGVFTTRHQELGSRRRTAPPPVHKQVWQSGELYTLEQFEAKSRDFSRSQLGRFKEVSPLLVESLFWKAVAAAEKPIYVEYANDVPGSGFCAPLRNQKWKKGHGPKCPYLETSGGDGRQQGTESSEREGTPGWRLSNSPWNLQMIARSPGSLTRFMPDEVPGVTSPMVYIGMLFSWFAWHVEDHELHSMNFLHMGSPKTWYAVPGEHAATVEEIMRVKGYGGNMDRLAAFTMLGEKTTLLSPEVLVESAVPCCRLVQHPGEYVVTFPRAYHVGFSHGFNCGEAANFATPQWLKVAKEAAVRRAAMNYLPMLSHQQLLYLLTMSFVSRIPRELLPGVRSSRLRDRKKEEREILVKKAFMNDMMNENHLLCALLAKESTLYAVLWEPELLPSPCIGSLSFPSSTSLELQGSQVDDCRRKRNHCSLKDKISFDRKTGKFCVGNELHEMTANLTSVQCNDLSSVETQNTACNVDGVGFNMEMLEDIDNNDDDLPYGLNADSGSLACVACGILGYPVMAIVQPSYRAWQELFPVNYEEFHEKSGKPHSCLPSIARKLHSDDSKKVGIKSEAQGNLDSSCILYPTSVDHAHLTEGACARGGFSSLNDDFMEFSSQITTLPHVIGGKVSRTISGFQVESISARMHQTSAISLPINSVNNDDRGHILSQVECQIDKFNPRNVDADFASNRGSNIDYSKALYSCDRSEEFEESVHVKASAIAECGSSDMNFAGLRPTYETNRLPGAPAEKSENKINKKWNTSSRFTKPRIFCLQHALEIEELLQCKGGANVLIICHSDYVKIKAHAMSVAEEIGMKFNCKDVPLENASPEELDLINISIDDEHEEHGEDWTSKLGLNLRYCIKLRKQSPANKKQLPLALAAIFSDPIPVSVVSDLKWHSRKSRTPYKVIGMIQSKPPNDSKLEIVEPMIGNPIKQIQVYQSRRSGLNEMGKNHDGRPTKSTPKELYSSKEMRTVDDRDAHISISGNMNFLNEEVENDSTESLLTVPVLSAENPHIHQELWTTEKVSITHDIGFAKSEGSTASTKSVIEVCRSQLEIQSNQLNDETTTICDPGKSQYHLSYTKDSIFDSSEMVPSKEAWSNCSVGGCQKLKFQSDIVAAEVNSSEVQHHETSVLYETNSLHGFHNTIDSSYESSARKTVDYSEDLHEVPVAWAPNFEGSFCNLKFLDDQPAVLASSSNNTEMQLEVSVTEEPMMNNPVSVVDDFETRQNEVSVGCDNNMPLQSQSTIDDQSFVPASSSNNTEMQLEVSITEEPKMDNPVFVVDDFEIRQSKVSVARENNMQLQSQFTIDGLIIDRYEMQQGSCCASEMRKNGTVTSFEMQPDLHSACEMEDNKVSSTEMQQEHHFASETGENGRVGNSIEPSGHAVAGLTAESYERQAHTATVVPLVVIDKKRDINIISHSDHSLQHNAEKDKGKSAIKVYKSYVRRNKRKIEAEHTTDARDSYTAFVRSPCEGLRPRASQAAYERDETKAAAKKAKAKATKMAVVSAGRSAKAKGMGSYQCDLDGCSMNFRTRRELLLHKRNLCTYKGCGKQFSSHQYTMHHQRVHDDERPLKCPWKGCNMSFKWAWARTEHIRLHTGERPYMCKAAGCGLTFRFVSDFSRHRRKTGHM